MEILNEQSSNKTSFWCVCSLVFSRLSLHSTVRANKSNDLNPKGALALKHRWQNENNVHKKCGSLVVAAVFVCVLTIRFLSEREISNEAWEKPTVNLSLALLFRIVFTYNRNAQNPFVIFEKAFHFGMIMRPPNSDIQISKMMDPPKIPSSVDCFDVRVCYSFPQTHRFMLSILTECSLEIRILDIILYTISPKHPAKISDTVGWHEPTFVSINTRTHTQTRWNDIMLPPLMHDFLNSLAWYFHLSHKKNARNHSFRKSSYWVSYKW